MLALAEPENPCCKLDAEPIWRSQHAYLEDKPLEKVMLVSKFKWIFFKRSHGFFNRSLVLKIRKGLGFLVNDYVVKDLKA